MSLAFWCVTTATSGTAQGPDASVDETDEVYDAQIDHAVGEFKRRNYAEAYAAFARAHERRPSARTLRGMGVSAFEARRYADAIVHLKAALEEGRRPLPPEQRAEVQGAVRSALEHVAVLELRLTPGNAVVQVDGRTPRREGNRLWVDPGVREIAVSATGYRPVLRRLQLALGEQMTLELELERETRTPSEDTPGQPHAAAAAQQSSTARVPPETRPAGPRPGADAEAKPAAFPSPAPIVVALAGAAMLASAAVTGLMVSDAKDELNENCVEAVCAPRYQAVKEQGETMRTLTNVLLVSGGAALALGATWWVLADDAPPSMRAACVPGGCSASLGGRF